MLSLAYLRYLPALGSMSIKYRSDDKSFLSPAFDVSVEGFDDDEQPDSGGADLMAVVVRILQEATIGCCFANEAALIYYGAHRMMLAGIPLLDRKEAAKADTTTGLNTLRWR
nr:hypothetical protein CFP56_16814 [Quercus suber]